MHYQFVCKLVHFNVHVNAQRVQYWSQLPNICNVTSCYPLSALSGQSYGCRISLKPYVQLQPMLVMSQCQLQKQHDQQPGL